MPYIPPKPRAPQPPKAEAESAQSTSSSITPAFINSSFEPTSKANIYSPQKIVQDRLPAQTDEAEPKPATVADSIDSESPTKAVRSVESAAPAPSVNKRASWSKRKPVPSNIVLPDSISPSAYSSARGPTSTRALPQDNALPSPASIRSGPVPPRRPNHGRSTSNIHTPLSPAESDMTEKSGLFFRDTNHGANGHTLQAAEEVETLLPPSGSVDPNVSAIRSEEPRKPIPVRRSSKRVPVELGKALSTAPSFSETADSRDDNNVAAETLPHVSPDRHALRMRIDKSLPSLPLAKTISGTGSRPGPQHRHMASTSTAPSTDLATPRSDSYSFTRQPSVPEEEGDKSQEKRKLKWLLDLSRSKKDKAQTERAGTPGAEQTEGTLSGSLPPSSADEGIEASEEDESFSVDRIPSKRRLWEAGTLFLRDENGELVCFGDMFPKAPEPVQPGEPTPPTPRTVVFFIRTFWCGQCQDYMFASLSQLDPEAVEKAGIRVIIIGNGSWKIIKSYRKLFSCPFPIYVDGPRKLYQLLGMTKLSNDFGPMFKGRAAYHQSSVPKQIYLGAKNGLSKMPLANPGNLRQLGGEFILSPGYNCDFAHRMTTRSDHMEAPDILREAGCTHPTKFETHEITIEENQRAEFERLELEMQNWRDEREAELDRIRRKKAERRGITYIPTSNGSTLDIDVDAQSDEARAPVPLPTEAEVAIETIETTDGPVYLPVGVAENASALSAEDDLEGEANRAKMDKLFREAMRLEGVGQEEDRYSKRKSVATFGRKASRGPNGFEVGVVDE